MTVSGPRPLACPTVSSPISSSVLQEGPRVPAHAHPPPACPSSVSSTPSPPATAVPWPSLGPSGVSAASVLAGHAWKSAWAPMQASAQHVLRPCRPDLWGGTHWRRPSGDPGDPPKPWAQDRAPAAVSKCGAAKHLPYIPSCDCWAPDSHCPPFSPSFVCKAKRTSPFLAAWLCPLWGSCV